MDTKRKELFEKLARAGFAALGITYGIIGVLAVMAAFGSGGGTTGSRGALATLTDSGWGTALLWFMALGLFGYALWRLASAGLDLENDGHGKKSVAKRIGRGISGISYFALSFYAVSLAAGERSGSSGGGGTEGMIAKLMSAPFGIFLVGVVGVALIAFAASQVGKAWKEKYRENIHLPEEHGFSNKAVKFGIIARAVVFTIIGVFILYAAITANPDQAVGFGGALDWLRSQSYGGILLGLIGLGLMGFAFYCLLQARYRVIPDPEPEARQRVRHATS